RQLGVAAEAHRLQEVARLLAKDAVGKTEGPDSHFPVGEHRVLNVLPDGQARNDVGDLEGPADAGAGDPVVGPPGDGPAVELHTSRAGLEAAGDQVEERRLARAVGSD